MTRKTKMTDKHKQVIFLISSAKNLVSLSLQLHSWEENSIQ